VADLAVALAGKPNFFKKGKTSEKAQDTEGGSTKDAPAEEGSKNSNPFVKKPAADTASKGSEAGDEKETGDDDSLESLEAWLKENAKAKGTPAYEVKASKLAALKKGSKKVGLSVEDTDDSAIVRLTRKM
jgi:hypothetical protein